MKEGPMPPLSPKDLHEASGFLVDVVLLIGAVAAVIKFRLFNILGHRWRSELACYHYVLPNSSVIFTADYTLQNTGQRPLRVTEVTMRLTAAREEGVLLIPDENRVYAKRLMRAGDPALRGLFQVEPGERTIFTLRTKLPDLDEAVFVLCDFSIAQKRVPAIYRGFYVKSRPAKQECEQIPRPLRRDQVDPPES
jgi:hypothetical protein